MAAHTILLFLNVGWLHDWKLTASDSITIVVAVLAAQLAHYICFALLRGAAKRRATFVVDAIVTHADRAIRFLFTLLAISIVLPNLILPGWLLIPAQHVLVIGYIFALTWLATWIDRHPARPDKSPAARGSAN